MYKFHACEGIREQKPGKREQAEGKHDKPDTSQTHTHTHTHTRMMHLTAAAIQYTGNKFNIIQALIYGQHIIALIGSIFPSMHAIKCVRV